MDGSDKADFRKPLAGWRAFIANVWRQMGRDNVSALASAIAFYAFLSIFPTLSTLVSLYGLVANSDMVEQQIGTMAGILPPEALTLIATWLHTLVREPTATFSVGLLISVVLTVWSLRSATGMLMVAVNICYGDTETRGFVRFNLEALLLGTSLALLAVMALALVAGLPVLLNLLPLLRGSRTIISLLRWPVLAGLAILALAIVYHYAPARAPRGWEWFNVGAAIATALWLIGSLAFTYYVATVGSYDKTYGSLGAVIVLLLWFYMSAYAILIGAEVNAAREGRAAQRD